MTELNLHLIVQLYGKPGSDVRDRMTDCITNNANIDFVSKITVMCESGQSSFSSKKIDILKSNGRATYADLLKIAQARSAPSVSHFAIANTDIILTPDILSLMDRLSEFSSVAAITRTESNGQLFAQPKYSQDFWIFKAHSFIQRVLGECGYKLGVAGCEHLFAMALYAHGYNIWNPCLDCKIIHNDPAPKLQWSDRYHGSYLFLPPCRIADVESEKPAYQVHLSRRDFEQDNTALPDFAELSKTISIKLHLCCGDKKLPGFLGVDIRPEVNPDIVASVDNLDMLPDEVVKEIYFCHGLEHLPFGEAEQCLVGLSRILRKGGTLRLALPDFEALSKLYVAGFSLIDEIRPAIHGGQDYAYNIHYASWDFRSLSVVLARCGFGQIKRYQPKEFLPDGYFDWSLHSLRGLGTSLNIVCIKSTS